MSEQSPSSERPWASLTDSAPVAIYHYLGPGLPLRTNTAFQRMFSLEAEATLDYEAWIMKIHPEDRSWVRAQWDNFDAQREFPGKEFRAQYRLAESAEGVRFVLERVVHASGMPGFVGVITDVTELVQAQTELERAHKALVTASRQAGMAEVATNVLHNVGNVLNSINVSVHMVDTRLRQMRIDGLQRVAALLEQQGDEVGAFLSTDRGKAVPRYLSQLASQLLADQAVSLQELASLVANVEHVKDIVRMQQSYASHRAVAETVALADLVNDSVRLNAAAFSRHGVNLKLDLADIPSLTVDKHKVLQILVNLVRNAKYACDESKRSDKCVIIQTRACPLGVRIAVIDNGIGIASENLTRIFSQGFTTRRDGHGFGLHSAALTARELNGSLQASSGGLGCGATFALELPLEPPE